MNPLIFSQEPILVTFLTNIGGEILNWNLNAHECFFPMEGSRICWTVLRCQSLQSHKTLFLWTCSHFTRSNTQRLTLGATLPHRRCTTTSNPFISNSLTRASAWIRFFCRAVSCYIFNEQLWRNTQLKSKHPRVFFPPPLWLPAHAITSQTGNMSRSLHGGCPNGWGGGNACP